MLRSTAGSVSGDTDWGARLPSPLAPSTCRRREGAPAGPRLFVKGALVDQCLSLLTALIRFRLKVLVNLPGPY